MPSVTPYPTAGAQANAALARGAPSAKDLTYGGGLTAGGLVGAGVTTGQPKVYLVFFGDQWGTQSTNGSGQAVFGNDPHGEAQALQTLYAGLGTAGERWSGIVTQYCDGTTVGSISCTSADQLVPYPSAGVLAGVWYDNSAAATSVTQGGATGHQLAAEAEAAATHFGNLTQASNRDTQYVIASPTGANPDGWANQTNGYCAYHDDTHDATIDGGGAVPGPILAFTNMPYVPDAGGSCGAYQVNSGANGILDGATSAASHEYAETLTDQFPESIPPGGWSNPAGSEIGDLCAYISAPNAGAAYNLTLGTGTVVVQGLWSNAADAGKGGCVQNAPIYDFPPSVAAFSPARGAAGSLVTIDGSNLNGATAVKFNGAPASIVADSPNAVVAAVPAAATEGLVTVTTSSGSATSRKRFIPSPTVTGFTPSSGAPGSLVTITGSCLAAAKKVTVRGKKAAVVSDSATRIVAVVPRQTGSGPVEVKTKGGVSASATVFTVT